MANAPRHDWRTTIHIDKAQIVATLRSRGLHDRADWVDRQMPLTIDTVKNASLLRLLDIDPATMPPVDQAQPPGGGHAATNQPHRRTGRP